MSEETKSENAHSKESVIAYIQDVRDKMDSKFIDEIDLLNGMISRVNKGYDLNAALEIATNIAEGRTKEEK